MGIGLNDNTVKRIAAVAYHRKSGGMTNNVSSIYHNLTSTDQINEIANAHTTDAMQHKFPHKDAENEFKRHIAVSAAMNRGTMDLVPSDQSNIMHQNPTSAGSEQV